MDWQPNTHRFKVIRRVGEGGMGVVYEAVDRRDDGLVALKTVKHATPATLARLKKEFRVLADLAHPNLIALYELVAENEEVFFTMEFVEGSSFHRWVRPLPPDFQSKEVLVTEGRLTSPTLSLGEVDPLEMNLGPTEVLGPTADMKTKGPGKGGMRKGQYSQDCGVLDLGRLRDATRQLAEGISAIHAAGMLHRDLKPANVIVTKRGRVVVLDFGLATQLTEESELAAEERPLEGTAAFMSPEQGARQVLSPASDWYAVGVMLFLSLTGRAPFVGGHELVLMDKQRFEPPSPKELIEGLPSDLCALCSELLRTDPSRRPPGTEVLRRLGSATVSRVSSRGSSQFSESLLVGRERELAILEDSLQQAVGSSAVMVQVSGNSGVGKSRLVHGFLSELESSALVLRGRCYEHELVPFKAVDSLIDALARHLLSRPEIEVEGLMPRDALALARAFPVLRQVEAFSSGRRREVESTDPQELRRRVFAALRELLTRLADRQPLVLAIDDLQWGDLDSATLLATLLRPPEAPPILVIGTHRSEDAQESAFLDTFSRLVSDLSIDLRTISLQELKASQAQELASLLLLGHANQDAHAEWIAKESGGNPLFVEELARHVRMHDSAKPGWASLSDALKARVGRLPDDAGRLLAMIAVVGRPVAREAVMRAAELSDPAVLSLLRAGSFIRSRLIAGEQQVECYHDRIRETTLQLLDASQVAHHHARLARSFEANRQPDPEALATHYYGAGDYARAAEFALQAAQRAEQTLAFDRAASFYQMVLQKHPDDLMLQTRLGNAFANAGRGTDAADAYFKAVVLSTSEAESLDLRCRASWQLLASGQIDRGLDALVELLSSLNLAYPSSPRVALASLVWGRTCLRLRGMHFSERDEREVPASRLAKVDALFAAAQLLGMVESVKSADFHVRSLRHALKVGEPKRVARALCGEVAFISLEGRSMEKRTDAVIARLRKLCTRLDDPATNGLAEGCIGMAQFNLGHFSNTIDHCIRSETILREQCTGFHWEIATAQLFQGFALALTGRVREIIERFPAIMKEANERGNLYAATSFKASLGFYLPLAKDDPKAARAEVDEAMEQWSVRGYHLQHVNAFNSRVIIDLYEQDGRAALARCNKEWGSLKSSLLLRAQLLRIVCWAGRGRAAMLALTQGGGSEALRAVLEAQRVLSAEKVAYSTSQARALSASLAFQQGDLDSAVLHLRQAIDLAREGEILMNEMCLARALGGLLGGSEGRVHIDEADRFFADQEMENVEAVVGVFAPGFTDG